MDLYKYYQREMDWLQVAGKEFAEANPGLDTFLHGHRHVADPHVDRLLEAVAFLAARIEKRLDDSLLKLAGELLEFAGPGLLDPQPALAILRMTPKASFKSEAHVPAGAFVATRSGGQNGTSISMATADPLDVHRIIVRDATLGENPTIDGATLTLHVGLPDRHGSVEAEDLPGSWSLWLAWNNLADAVIVRWALRHHVKGVRLVPVDDANAVVDDALGIDVPDIGDLPGILPEFTREHPGYRLARETFALPERACLCRITGLNTLDPELVAGGFCIELDLGVPRDTLPLVSARNFVPYTTAAVNVWRKSCRSVDWDGSRERAELVPDHGAESAILKVLSVRALALGGDRFEEIFPYDYHNRDEPSYRVTSETVDFTDGQASTKWYIGLRNVGSAERPATVIADLLCCDVDAQRRIRSQVALDGRDRVPGTVSASISGEISPYVAPPMDERQYWELVEILSGHLTTLCEGGRLRRFLRHMDRTDAPVSRAAIASIRDASIEIRQTTIDAHPVNLAEVTVSVDPEGFVNEGYLDLFGDILFAMLSDYVPLNHVLGFTLKDEGRKMLYRREPEVPW